MRRQTDGTTDGTTDRTTDAAPGLSGQATVAVKSGGQRHPVRLRWIVTLPVAAILLLTVAAVVTQRRAHRRGVQMAFEQSGDHVVYSLAQRLSIYAELLQSVSALFETTERIEEPAFQGFVERTCGQHPEVQGIGWAPLVRAQQRDAFLAQQQRRWPGYQFQRWVGDPDSRSGQWQTQREPWSSRYYPLTWFWPEAPNSTAAGIDFLSHPDRREAIDAAIRQDRTMASGPLEVVSEKKQARGIVLARSIHSGAATVSDDGSNQTSSSVVVAALRFAPIVAAVLSNEDREALILRISDSSPGTSGQLVLFQDPRWAVAQHGRPTSHQMISFAGRQYACEFIATDQFIGSQSNQTGLWIAMAGLATATLAGALIQTMVSRNETIQRLVDHRTEAIRVAKERLAIAKNEVEAIFDSTPAPLLIVDHRDRVTGANDAARSLFGDEANSVIGRPVRELIWWPRRPIDASVCPELIQQGCRSAAATTSSNLSLSFTPEGAVGVRDDETAFPIETRCRRIQIPSQKQNGSTEPPLLYLLSVTDLTERLKNQENLRESEQRMDLALAGADLGTWDWDLVGDRVTYSDRWGEMLGLQPHQLRPTVESWKGLIHPSDSQAAQDAIENHLRGHTPQYNAEYRMRHSAGHWIWVLARGRITHRGIDGVPRRICGTQMDITDRRTAEERLRDKQVEIQQIFEALPDAVVVTNLRRQIVRVNSAFTRIFGHEAGEVLGRDTQYLYADPEDYQRKGTERFNDQGKTDYRPYEVLYRRRDGQTFPSETIGTTVLDGQHRVVGYLGLIRDITERREAQTQLQDSYAALKVSNSALRQSNAELDQFAYVASHDLRGPLRGIAYLAQWVTEDCGASLSPDGLKHLRDMGRMIRRMEQFLSDLLTYSRIGRKPVGVQRFDVTELLGELRLMVDPSNVATLKWPDESLILNTGRSTLQRVLLNLIGNAIRHHRPRDTPVGAETIVPDGGGVSTPAGGGVIELASRPLVEIAWRLVHPEISAGTDDREQLIQFTIDDNGAGIEPAFRKRIFDMFCTLKPRDEVEGSGMGLAIVKKLIESRGGSIDVTDNPRGGARFVFTWPQHRDLAEFKPAGQPAPPSLDMLPS